ncbi:hypothetical protein BLA24_22505 [Streptomyces cinnamoneus]|uniref:Uncharacterized protein n=1 Tax=Streptomyces cinnamoneus TaxID=53446 RepID=A0A2G1XGG6_STRCJ|nr:hypothetical protein [Streptomyces cinnamoneus]PHQ50322.1 hypothetical protein BLA24_22505 [Streptomyces cinnamoneus]PPT12891.1 hypothetical protein CYQ11_08285 [Streptomyces cinnamoneus]
MPQHTHALSRPCSHCDGFPAVAVTTGRTTPTGHRETITATCPACRGTGTSKIRPVLVAAGR